MHRKLSLDEVFKIAFDKNVAPTAIFNIDTTIAMVNDAYCELSGYTREEIVGSSWTQKLPPNELIRLKEYNELRISNPELVPNEYDFYFYTKQGTLKHCHVCISNIVNNTLFVLSFVDITEEKNNEDLLVKQSIELKKLVTNKDNELTFNLIQLSNNNESISRMRDKLKQIKPQLNTENINLVEDINILINDTEKQITPISLESLYNHLKITQPTFLTDLINKHPNLTTSEIKLCTFLRLNISTKDIANIINITYESVRVSRTRLRKKLKLKNEDGLVAYLMQF